MSLYAAADAGDLEQVTLLVEQGEDKNQVGGYAHDTALGIAAWKGYLDVVRYPYLISTQSNRTLGASQM